MAIRWGVIGCGDIVQKRVATAIVNDPNSEFIAACRRDRQQLKAFCEEFRVPNASTQPDDLFADPNLDAIYVATPVNLHCPHTKAAANAGKHVLVEKPMAMNMDECQQMMDVGRRNNVNLGVAYYRRFYPVVLRMRELMNSGTIGTVMSVFVQTGNPLRFTHEQPGHWRVVPEAGGGGPVMDIGSHRIDLMHYLFGKIESVQSECSTFAKELQVEDCASVLLRFESGVHGVLQCYFGTSDVADQISIVGSDGRLECEPLNQGNLTIFKNGETKTEHRPSHPNLHAPLIEDFSLSILENREPLVSGRHGMETNDVIAKIYAS